MNNDNLIESAKMEAGQNEIHKKIREFANRHGLTAKGLKPVMDGVADIPGYIESRPKIMWILKGAYPSAEGNDEYEIWDCWNNEQHNLPSWIPLIRILSALRHRHDTGERIELRDMPPIDDKALNDFKKSAYINICKTPYKHGADGDENLMKEAELWRDIVREQIALYKPDIILCGGTFDLIKIDTDHTYIDHTPTESLAHIYKDSRGTILFNAYHPSYVGGYRKDLLDYYVDEIADSMYMHYTDKKK